MAASASNVALVADAIEAFELIVFDLRQAENPNLPSQQLRQATEGLLTALGITHQELAKALSVNPITVYRWANGLAIPRSSHMDRIRLLARSKTTSARHLLAPAQFGDKHVGLWLVDYFFACAECAVNIYVIRTSGQFLAENRGTLESRLRDVLNQDENRLVVYLCPAHLSGPEEKKTETQKSFDRLKKQFQIGRSRGEKWPAEQLQLSPLSDVSDAKLAQSCVDLGRIAGSTFVLELHEQGKDEFGREALIFSELPVQGYWQDADGQFRPDDDANTFGFVQLPNSTANEVWLDWKRKLQKISNDLRKKMDDERRTP